MDVRDAVEADADHLAGLTDAPTDVMRNLIHDRTVRVAYDPEATDGDEPDGTAILGFVSFDAREQTVHVTQLQGAPAVHDRLLEEPVDFARGEGMAVELLVPETETDVQEAAVDAGFADDGGGPRFGGEPTRRFRLEPES